MKPSIRSFACVSLLSAMAVGTNARAADTNVLRVTGMVKPSACTFGLRGENIIDYRSVQRKELQEGKYTRLAAQFSGFSITCPQRTFFGLNISDNRASSVITDAYPSYINWGLGTVDGVSIGGYLLTFQPNDTRVDGLPGVNYYSSDRGKSWDRNPGNGQLSKDLTYLWSQYNNNPGPLSTVNAIIRVTPFINKLENLPAFDSIRLDGSLSFELVYL